MEKHNQYNLNDFENYQDEEVAEFSYIEDLKENWGSSPTEVYTFKDLRVKRTFFVDNNNIYSMRGQRFNRTLFSTVISGSVYSVSVQDYLIGITNLSYAPSIGLPKPKDVGVGKCYVIKDEAGGAGTTTITVRSANEETIDGASTSTITTNYASKGYYTDGANWFTYQT